MTVNVTAVYRTGETAETVRRELEAIGIAHGDVQVVPDRSGGLGWSGEDDLSGLNLPDDDRESYRECLRQGDSVVSVAIEDADSARVEAIMRNPERGAREFAPLDQSFRNADPAGDPLTAAGLRSPDLLDPEHRNRRRDGDETF